MFKNSKEKIQIGDKVVVAINDTVQELEIVGFPRGDIKTGKISFMSPIAQAILGKSYPEDVTVILESGKTINCRIIKLIPETLI
jgi:transcription elongation GreA/GreB family factor